MCNEAPFSHKLNSAKAGFDCLCLGLTTCQRLWVILCRLSEKGRKEIVEEMKAREREERRK